MTERKDGEAAPPGSPVAPGEESRLYVTLGPRGFEIARKRHRTLFDFENDRRFRIDVEAKTYVETSLLATVAFIEMEMRNRQRMSRILVAGGKKDAALPPFELAAQFGWSAPGEDESATKLTLADGGGRLVAGERELARWTASAHALPVDLRGSYERFLHYFAHPHPAVRAAMGLQTHLAAELHTGWRTLGSRCELVLSLVSAKPTETPPSGIIGLRRVFGDGELGALAKRVLSPSDDEPVKRLNAQGFAALAAEARKQGRFLDAGLLLLECGLQTGDAMLETFRELRSDEAAARALAPLFKAIGAGGTDPEQALKDWDALERKDLTHPHFIDIFRANALAQLGRTAESHALLLATLKQGPWLAAAYKDLGDRYYQRFETHQAWLCWEIGRHITPRHPNWGQLSRYEEYLIRTFAAIL